MKRLAPLAALALLACGPASNVPDTTTPGGRLEAAARSTGLVVDPARAAIVGSWSRDTDRLCIVPGDARIMRIGATVDYGEGQRCAASGTVRRSGERLSIAFGDCRFDARFAGGRIVFPAELPPPCDRLCSGRASLAALSVEPLSNSISEALALRDGDRLLCGPD